MWRAYKAAGTKIRLEIIGQKILAHLDRGYGKPPQSVAVGGDPNAPPVQTKQTIIYSGVLAKLDEKV